MESRSEQIIIETDRHRISGYLTLPADGYRSRMSDFLNASDRSFIAMTDVRIEPLGNAGQAVSRSFVAVSRAHIVIAMPAGEASASGAADQTATPGLTGH